MRRSSSSSSACCESVSLFPAAMRKYYKLSLLIVTGVSLTFLVFYKSQYDKLYNVLQVLEFFGRDGAGKPPDT